jgi:GT2 family glycosyltransferase
MTTSHATSIGVLITCFNRRDLTLRCLESVAKQELGGRNVVVTPVVVDDGSSDGTAEAISSEFPFAELIRGDGTLFWSGGMQKAWNHIAQRGGTDFVLWLNNDTVLERNAIAVLMATHDQVSEHHKPAIVVGSACHPETGKLTYGGLTKASRWRPLAFAQIQPSQEAINCATMCGNCVLVPWRAFVDLGGIDGNFIHSMGDLDFGLRAVAGGYRIWVAPGFLSQCINDNVVSGTWLDPELPLSTRLMKLRGPKGLPSKAWSTFARRHARIIWPFYSAMPYVKVLATWGRHRFLRLLQRAKAQLKSS